MMASGSSNRVYYLYTGSVYENAPANVTHLKIHPSIKVIASCAFINRTQLIHVELNEGLTRIGEVAFEGCSSLERISIPSTVNIIHPAAFHGCTRLVHVELRDGLERIERLAFDGCTSLQQIYIPYTVKNIGKHAFWNCSSLLKIEFCDEIEDFVSEVSLDWWNQGVSELSIVTYMFLVHYRIPERLRQIRIRRWKIFIHKWLKRFASERFYRDNSPWFFDPIDKQLTKYTRAQDVTPFLELILWQSKLSEQCAQAKCHDNCVNMRLKCRHDSLTMAIIIIPNVLPFIF